MLNADMQAELPTIPGYEIYPGEPLGEGGFAKVYLAKHKSFQIDVALKIMDSELAKDSEFCKRFLREGRICAKLGTHPNIMNIYDIGCVDDMYYFSMQLLSGPSLNDFIDNKGESEGGDYRPLEVLLPVVEALGYAHRNGFVHRDIKPANILFNENGEAMLSDFGIAKSFDQHTLSAAGAAIGTPAYMSPEQATASEDLDGRSDLYSLGVVLFELLSGEQPYKSDTPIGTMLQHVNGPVPQLPESQKIFQPLITNLMAKDPADRYLNSEALLVDMKQLISDASNNDATIKILDSFIVNARQRRGFILSLVSVSILAFASVWMFKYKDLPIFEQSQDTSITETDEPSNVPAADSQFSSEVSVLMERAALFESVGDLVAPPGSNALEIYEQILRIEPNQTDALRRRNELIKQVQ